MDKGVMFQEQVRFEVICAEERRTCQKGNRC